VIGCNAVKRGIPKMERDMSGRNMEYFLENSEEFLNLSEDQQATLLTGGILEGETANEGAEGDKPSVEAEGSESPDAAVEAAEEAGKEEKPAAEAEPEPVVLARDGKHTIPFSELESARTRVQELERLLAEKGQPAAVPDQKEEKQTEQAQSADTGLADLVRERDEALYQGDTEKAHELSLKIIGVQQELATQAAIAAMEARESKVKVESAKQTAMEAAQAKADEMLAQNKFLDPNDSTFSQDAVDLVIAQRDRLMASGMPPAEAIEKAVAKVAPLFQKTVTADPTADVAAKAAEVISKAQSKVPTSLSSMPAGSAPQHDEGEAIREMSGLSLISAFEGMSSDQIMKKLSRVI